MRNNRIRLLTVLAVLILSFWIILKVDNLLLSLVLAFVIYYLLSPLVSYLERKGLSRAISTTVLYGLTLTLMTGLVVWLFPVISNQVNALKLELPRYIEGISALVFSTESRVNEFLNSVYTIDISQELRAKMFSWASVLFEGLPGFAQNFLSVTVLAPFFAFFMLLDGRQASRNLLALVPNNFFEMALHLLHQLGEQMGHFIRARLLEALIVGLVVWGGLALIDFRFAALFALFAALTNLIPYVGPLIGAVPAVALAVLNGSSSVDLFFLLLVYGVAQLVDIVFIIPLVVAKIVNLHPVTVVIVIIIGAQLMGVLGMIISIPVASALKLVLSSIFTHVIDFRR